MLETMKNLCIHLGDLADQFHQKYHRELAAIKGEAPASQNHIDDLFRATALQFAIQNLRENSSVEIAVEYARKSIQDTIRRWNQTKDLAVRRREYGLNSWIFSVITESAERLK